MTDEVKMVLDDATEKMGKAIDHLESELHKIRAGKANPSMLDNIRVDYYGTSTPLKNVASVNTPDPRTLMIQAWEKTMLEPICKAILEANLGFNPQNNGDVVIINVPILTEERRKELSKRAHSEGEIARVSIRSIRHEAITFIKQEQKDGLPEDEAKGGEVKVQELTDKYNRKVDEVIAAKDKDILNI